LEEGKASAKELEGILNPKLEHLKVKDKGVVLFHQNKL